MPRAAGERPQHEQVQRPIWQRRRSFAHTLIARVASPKPSCLGKSSPSEVPANLQVDAGAAGLFTLKLVGGRLQGEMFAELNGESFTGKVDAGRAKAK